MQRFRSWPVIPQMIPPSIEWVPERPDPDHRVHLAFGTDRYGNHFRRCTYPDGSSDYTGLEYPENTSATETAARRFLGVKRGT